MKKYSSQKAAINFIKNNTVPILFFIICLGGVIASKLSIPYILNEIVNRLDRNLFLVLSLIIPVVAGMGLNFALVIGAMAGQIGLITIKVLNIGGITGLFLAALISIPFALLFGYGTGKILNRTKGKEMITSLILGFFAMGLYQLVFLLFVGTIIPIKNPEIVLPGGVGLKNAIDLTIIQYALDDLLSINVMGIKIPIFSLFIIGLLCLFTKFILKTKIGQDFRALGQDMHVAEVAGIDVDRTRLMAITISTLLAAWGQIIFLQNIGTLQTYSSHEQVGMFAVAAILVGGATVTRATIGNAILGTILFHTLFIVSPNAGKNLFGDPQIGEFFRSFVAYGVIALSLVLHAMQKNFDANANVESME
ncbi:ABC transporter permease subunit [Thermosediminibacter litoriperuensis]|uniref:Simple sugar transport system permease protein n=1 Tax=Thermosediminibacter litoriperuensis TaxID=291989 RepID=A0A5S5AZT8_9FIRM|nr:ABC transporter permease [Thermosediminibacter litoriperuensis]TYP58486.1 simple sugar transport system permease protein [Thermosediminibacter litoriperuensis]